MAFHDTTSLPGPRVLRLASTILCFLLLAAPSAAQEKTDPAEPPPDAPASQAQTDASDAAVEDRLPEDIKIDIGKGSYDLDPETGDVIIDGEITILWQDTRFQADHVVVRERRYLEAEGNVVVVWGQNRITGSRMVYDLDDDRGFIENAIGEVEPDFQFTAKRAEKIGEEKVRVKGAMVTTCTQPVPYWSFRVSTATIKMGGYARLWNVRPKIGKAPVFYLPYLIWPAKKTRSAGLLFPDVSSQSRQGAGITQPVFFPIGDSADITVSPSWFEKAGWGVGIDARAIPNPKGIAAFNGFWIRDKVSEAAGEEPDRYSINYRQTQEFQNGFRMVADINTISDFNFYNDYARDLNITSLPNTLARLEFSRNGKWASLNVRQQRREQLYSNGETLVQQAFPEIELRGRSRRLGKTPLYLDFISSGANLQQNGVQSGRDIDADYQRFDLFPTLSIPLSRVPWLDFTPRLSYRWTWWSQSERDFDVGGVSTTRVVDEPLTRNLGGLGFDLVGPRTFRVFETKAKEKEGKDGKKKAGASYKNIIEPVISYTYSEGFDELDRVILYDEVDPFGRAGNSVTYALRTRLFAKRPRAVPGLPAGGEAIVMPDGNVSAPPRGDLAVGDGLIPEARNRETPEMPPEEEQQMEPVEIATLEIRQTRSFSDDLSFADLDGDGTREETSRSSSVFLTGRYNPTPKVSLKVQSRYHILYKNIETVNVSGDWFTDQIRLGASLVRTNALGSDLPDRTQLNFDTTFRVWRNKIMFKLKGTWDWDPQPGQPTLPQRQWSVSYSTQCCTFYLERLNRNFSSSIFTSSQRNDYYFRIDLRGVGKLLQYTF